MSVHRAPARVGRRAIIRVLPAAPAAGPPEANNKARARTAMEDHKSFVKTPKQLAIVVALAFAIPIALIGLLSQLVTGMRPGTTDESEAGVLRRIKPVGEVTLAEASAPKGNMTGEQV